MHWEADKILTLILNRHRLYLNSWNLYGLPQPIGNDSLMGSHDATRIRAEEALLSSPGKSHSQTIFGALPEKR